MNELYAGAARVSIDPTADMYPMPTGFAVKEGIYNSVHVRALALKSGGESVLMLVFELSDMPMVDGLLEKVSEACGIPAANIIITWTHNHTSPRDFQVNNYGRKPDPEDIAAKRRKYKDIELDGAIKAAQKAVGSMKPARIAFGKTESYINVNRDYHSFGGYWVEAQNMTGYSDKTLGLIKIVDENEKVIAVLLNYGIHNVCAMEGADIDGISKTSSNLSGITCEFLETIYGEDSVVLWTAGCSGNQNPVLAHNLQYEYPDGYTSSVEYPNGVGFMQMEYMGRIHAVDAQKKLEEMNVYDDSAPIRHFRDTFELPAQKRRKTPDGKWINPRSGMGGNGIRNYEEVPYGQVPALPDMDRICEPDPDNTVKMEVHVVSIGSIALVFTNGEMYAELGKQIKDLSPVEKTLIVTYSVAPSTSYIVDKSSVGHKVFQSFGAVAPGKSDEIILDGMKKLLEKC